MDPRFYVTAPMKVLYFKLYIIVMLEVKGTREVNNSGTLQRH